MTRVPGSDQLRRAVSGTIKQLIPTGMVERVRAARRDHYRFREHAWATLMSSQNTVLA